MTTIARAIGRTDDGYKSQHERWFARFGQYALESHFGCAVVRMNYEPCSWRLPGGRYTPDFYAILEDGRVVFIEVKGSRQQRGYRDAMSKLRAAAALHPEFVWCECLVGQNGRKLELEVLKP